MEASNLNRRDFLTGLAALTALSLPHLSGPENSDGKAGEAAEIDTSPWDQIAGVDVAWLEDKASYFEEQAVKLRALIAKLESAQ